MNETIDPMQFIDQELRAKLTIIDKMMGGDSIGNITADMLPRVRDGAEKYAHPPLSTPPWQERMIPGSHGSPAVRVYVVDAKPGELRPAILYIHGGGFIMRSAKTALATVQKISSAHDCVVVNVDYRLAPETPFPGALNDNYAALQWLHDHADELGVDRMRIAVMGESAGGGLAAMLTLAARDRGEIPINQQILIYSMLDDRTGSGVNVQPWMGRYVWTAKANQIGWSSFLGVSAGSISVPAGSVPAREENLKGLPPTFIAVGSADLFANENIDYARRLLNAGVATELYVAPGGFHGFDEMLPESAIATQFSNTVNAAIHRAFNKSGTEK
jgi:acetyl esterase/lipase